VRHSLLAEAVERREQTMDPLHGVELYEKIEHHPTKRMHMTRIGPVDCLDFSCDRCSYDTTERY
jgi:hypothetical protein